MSHPTPQSAERKYRIAKWLAAKEELGTAKALARKLGMEYRAVTSIIEQLRKQQANLPAAR